MNNRFFSFLLLLMMCQALLIIPHQLFAQGIVPSTNSLNIGSFCPGYSGTRTVTLTNDEAVAVDLSNYEFVEGGWGDFFLLEPTSFPYALNAGESVDAVIQFTPEFDTMYVMTLRFYTTSSQTPSLDITLLGDGYGADCDADSIPNALDNCPVVSNPDQDDFDNDNVGDACDNCPRIPNAWDVDTDGDGIYDAQSDADMDGIGDICDDDNDNDGCADDIDSHPFTASVDDEFVCKLTPPECGNFGDGYGADCDTCPHVYNPDTQSEDADGDGVGDECDNCPNRQNPFDVDTDSDGIFDAQKDTDGDGLGDACDTIEDSDNDGCSDDIDPYPLVASVDDEFVCSTEPPRCGNFGDGYGADCDNCPHEYNPDTQADDADGDRVGDDCDNCYSEWNPFDIDTNGDGILDEQSDHDADGIGDVCDDDNDNDGCLDADDPMPLVYSNDTDGDGSGNDCDDDDDNDGYQDSVDSFPLDPSEWADSDGDGIGNNSDLCLFYASSDNSDTDGDSEGDACDCDDVLQGGDEEAIDCGGACPACIECTWCKDSVTPLRVSGSHNMGQIDVVFIADGSYRTDFNKFIDDATNRIRDSYFNIHNVSVGNIPLDYKDRFNFYYFNLDYGDHTVHCYGEAPSDFWSLASFTDAAVILYDADSGDGCSMLKEGSSTILKAPGRHSGQVIHENGHGIYGLVDEYCGNTSYKQNNPEPNVWDSLDNCQDFASLMGWDPNNCTRIQDDDGCSKEYWKYDPARCMMEWGGLPDIRLGDKFGVACVNRINYVYDNWPVSDTKGILVTLNLKNNLATLLGSEVVDSHPDVGLGYGKLLGIAYSSTGEALGQFGVSDPRVGLSFEAVYFDDIDFSFIFPFYDNLKAFELKDSETEEILIYVDLTIILREHCSDANFDGPECQSLDLDNDGTHDYNDGCPDDPLKIQAGFCGCGTTDADTDADGVPDCNDNCPDIQNFDQSDTDSDGIGDACEVVGDTDGDGIIDRDDKCLQTEHNTIVDSNGCSIQDLCPCNKGWKNHGAYMKCIALTSENFASSGFITYDDKDYIVSQAAQSYCGYKN